jgi:hypothetical protein
VSRFDWDFHPTVGAYFQAHLSLGHRQSLKFSRAGASKCPKLSSSLNLLLVTEKMSQRTAGALFLLLYLGFALRRHGDLSQAIFATNEAVLDTLTFSAE